MSILVFVEIRDHSFKRPGIEAACETVRIAQRLSKDAHAIIIGHNITDLAPQLGQYGIRKVFIVDEERFSLYTPEGYARAVVEAAKKIDANYIFLAATAMGRDLAPTIAALFHTSAVSDCIELIIKDSEIVVKRPLYAGKVLSIVGFKKFPAIITLRPNVFEIESSPVQIQQEELKLTIDASQLKTVIKQIIPTSEGKVELTEARVIVSGGRGFKGPENFHLRDELARILNAATGATRAVVDAGWRPYLEQVGQTGKTVCPDLYMAIGLSGAIQHLAGMSSSKVIVAINKDPEAPIFKVATYGIVGDLFEVVPVLIKELKETLAR